jgi:hypothetical protein
VKSPVLFSVSGDASDYEPLFAAARERGARVGWLELNSAAARRPAPEGPPFTGAFRTVEVNDCWTVSTKPRKGRPVLRDLLREYFLGADVVLVQGLDLFPKLSRRDDAWRVEEAAGRARTLSTSELLDRARKPELRWRDAKAETK